MVDAFFRISVIDGALSLCHHRRDHQGLSVNDAVRHLQHGPAYLAGYDYKRAIELGGLVGWDSFALDGTRQIQLQQTIQQLATRLKPF